MLLFSCFFLHNLSCHNLISCCNLTLCHKRKKKKRILPVISMQMASSKFASWILGQYFHQLGPLVIKMSVCYSSLKSFEAWGPSLALTSHNQFQASSPLCVKIVFGLKVFGNWVFLWEKNIARSQNAALSTSRLSMCQVVLTKNLLKFSHKETAEIVSNWILNKQMTSASSYILCLFPDFNWSIKSLATFGLAHKVQYM